MMHECADFMHNRLKSNDPTSDIGYYEPLSSLQHLLTYIFLYIYRRLDTA